MLSLAERVSLRSVAPEDEDFLLRVYSSTREVELYAVPWSEDQKQAFVRMQFQFQTRGYATDFPSADRKIIMLDGLPIGRLIVDRSRTDEIRCIDIAILPAYRNRGVGSFLMKNLLLEAEACRKLLRLLVEKTNPAAQRFYERLGLVVTEETASRRAMESRPPVGS